MKLNSLRKRNNERGSISIEFLGVLPFYFLFFLLLWQTVASGYAVFVTRAAVNDAAKVYAIGQGDYQQVAKDYIGDNDLLKYVNCQVSGGGKDFTMVLEVRHGLSFIPASYRDKVSINFKQEVTGRMLDQ